MLSFPADSLGAMGTYWREAEDLGVQLRDIFGPQSCSGRAGPKASNATDLTEFERRLGKKMPEGTAL